MTKEEIIKEYGNIELKFYYYFKYVFTFSGKTDKGYTILASIGGDLDDIYRYNISNDRIETLKTLDPNSIVITHNDTTIVEWSE